MDEGKYEPAARYIVLPMSITIYYISGAFLWDYSVDSYSGIRITEHTEYQFPKEQTLCYSENRIADVTKIKAMRPRKSGYAIFPSKDGRNTITGNSVFLTNRYSVYSVNSAIGSRIDGILFCSFRNQNRSQKNTICQFCVFSFQKSPKRTRPWSNHAVLRDIFNCGALQAYISTHDCNVGLKEAQFKMSAKTKKPDILLCIDDHPTWPPQKTLFIILEIVKFLNYSYFAKIMMRKPNIVNLTNMTELYPFLESEKWYLLFKDFVVT